MRRRWRRGPNWSELAEAAGAILQIGHLERFNAGIMALAQRITAPRYIEAQRMGGFVERATDVDVVSDLMIHDIDIILSLVASEIRNITAVGSPVLTEHVDIATAQIEFVNGTVANVVASRVSDKKMRRIRVFQPGMYLSLDFIDQTIDIAEPDRYRARSALRSPVSGSRWSRSSPWTARSQASSPVCGGGRGPSWMGGSVSRPWMSPYR